MLGRGKQGGQPRKQKVAPKKKVVEVTLEQVYKGDLIEVEIQRYRLCEDCKGAGGEGVQKCAECKGRGAVVKMVQVGPMMYQQLQ